MTQAIIKWLLNFKKIKNGKNYLTIFSVVKQRFFEDKMKTAVNA
jgi:hypothetical protein